jgi:hypothetical protein
VNVNGGMHGRNIAAGLVVTLLLAVSGWTVKRVEDLSLAVARIEADEAWEKAKLNQIKPDAD